jgi:hypothetical protein
MQEMDPGPVDLRGELRPQVDRQFRSAPVVVVPPITEAEPSAFRLWFDSRGSTARMGMIIVRSG